MTRIQKWFMVIILAGLQEIKGLVLRNISVPLVVDYRHRATLSCSYEMGKHQLNSVKWYKDKEEFFRYSPMAEPSIITFNVPGISISNRNQFCNKGSCRIELERLSPKSSGQYRCEVSGDAPEFKLISQTANMTVAALPQHDPFINGLLPRYRYNDFIVANCTADWSSPAATLSWYINGARAPFDLLQPQQETTMKTDHFILHKLSLELRFHLDKARFKSPNGDLEIKCVADIVKIPSLLRFSVFKAKITSDDELHNQKLVNRKNSGFKQHSYVSKSTMLLAYTIFTLHWYIACMVGSSHICTY
ncbi:uncharacterized protein LOC119652741 isoform X2 [Hermetia illucens]|uniref:uncharacterized protein LOC119652741 isoform X2 n=1 Tax=Hermetia illucens TaxID=343691 RepID=UPI0018CC49E4|nr:uncharacterized protein LOC119652741 isoform X2 [Hermetia illucens]